MASSQCYLCTHIVFSTKGRKRYIKNRDEMNAYVAGIIRKVSGIVVTVNGQEDHLHILCLLPKELSIAEFVRTIKANSSKWYGQTHEKAFAWQEGYSAISVSPAVEAKVKNYIANQDEHHQNLSLQDEFDEMLRVAYRGVVVADDQ